MASKFAEYKPNKLSRMGCNVGGLPQAENKRRTQGSVSGYLDNLPQRLIDKAVKDFSNKTTEGWCWNLELAVNTSNISSDNEVLTFDYYLTVLFNDVIKLVL